MWRRSTVLSIAIAALLSAGASFAQEASPPADAGSATPAVAANPTDQLLSEGELEQLVASIALYPDDLLSTVLMASTYPLEVVEADRWVRSNSSLKGDALKAAVEKQPWDETVKSLVATPQVLATMSEQVEWTEKLGNAVLAQQDDLMAAVQRLRLKAKEAGYLKTTKEQTVTVESGAAASESAPAASEAVPSGGGAVGAAPSQVVVIQSTHPAVVSVPYYDPTLVYGGWAYPSYPPYFWQPAAGYYGYYPGWYPGQALVAGVSFGLGVPGLARSRVLSTGVTATSILGRSMLTAAT
jgi:hypothetical protein